MTIFYILFGFLFLLYVVLAIIKRVRSPKKGERTVHARIDSIFKLRTPIEIPSRERQVPNNTIVAPSVCQVSFCTDQNEHLSFSIDSEQALQWKEDMPGTLTFNGELLLAFKPD